MIRFLMTCILLVATPGAMAQDNALPQDEVLVLGVIHGGHTTSEQYGLDRLAEIIRRIEPDYILTEIPPDRLAAAKRQFRETGHITESRVRVFPEYVDVIFPLQREMQFEIVPCAGWTREMADDRRSRLAEWRETRPEETAEVRDARRALAAALDERGSDDPLFIHTDAYDDLVRAGMEPYQRLFGDDLGAGGWDNINQAHYDLIAEAIETRGGEGKRFLITFGAYHKYWFVDQLRQRDDITVLDPTQFLAEDGNPDE